MTKRPTRCHALRVRKAEPIRSSRDPLRPSVHLGASICVTLVIVKLLSCCYYDSGVQLERTHFRLCCGMTINLSFLESTRALDGRMLDPNFIQIAVMGDQSCGKSSVLEALSGVQFPRGSGLVTRCPVQLIMKRTKTGEQWRGRMTVTMLNFIRQVEIIPKARSPAIKRSRFFSFCGLLLPP